MVVVGLVMTALMDRLLFTRPKRVPARIRTALEKLGPTFMKIGQILSLRSDIIPLEYCDELKKLLDAAPPFSFDAVKAILESELGQPFGEVFKALGPRPLAAASLAQVHSGVLRNGHKVAVKVQRPGIRPVIERDLTLLRHLAFFLEKYIPPARNFRPLATVKEIYEAMVQELDFNIEARNAQRFRDNFQESKTVRIPRIYWKYTTGRVIVMEFIEGIRVDAFEELAEAGIDKKQVALNACHAILKQIFIDGFFHADPHPANVFAFADNSVCFLDFGMFGEFNEEQKKQMLLILVCMIRGDEENYIRNLVGITETGPGSDLAGFIRASREQFRGWYGSTVKEYSMSLAFFRALHIGARYTVLFPSNLIIFAKVLVTTETVAAQLDPDFSIGVAARPFVEDLYSNLLVPKEMMRLFERSLSLYIIFLRRLLRIWGKTLERFETETIGIFEEEDPEYALLPGPEPVGEDHSGSLSGPLHPKSPGISGKSL